MEQLRTKIKKWGNSFGILVPAGLVQKEKLGEGAEVTVTIESERKTKVGDVFGILRNRIKRDTQKALDQINKDFWPENE